MKITPSTKFDLEANTFEEYEQRIKEIRTRLSVLNKCSNCSHVSDLLFRGHRDASWKLETSLERQPRNSNRDDNLGVTEYYEKILGIQSRVESLADQSWKLQPFCEYRKGLVTNTPHNFLVNNAADEHMEMYRYFAYLRHHNFPSPLLDWTQCEYMAAFFAFRHVDKCAKKVAVYLFLEYAGSGKSGIRQIPHIQGLGHNVTVHPRHNIQKAEYTICTAKVTLPGAGNAKWLYAEHDKARCVQTDSAEGRQDLLWKIELPFCSKEDFSTRLDAMGINEDGLFKTENVINADSSLITMDDLMETLTLETFPRTSS